MKLRKHTLILHVLYALVIVGLLLSVLWGSRAVTTISQSLPLERERCIVIDAGHGGEDGGAVSCTGVPESRINLEIASRLNDLLHLLGYETYMIRTTDTSVYTKGNTLAQKKISDLKERVRIIQSTPGSLLISIHQNHFTDSRYRGPQVFYADTQGSEALAKQLQTSLTTALHPGSNRQSKQSKGVYVMDQITCTGVLVECGFLSHPQEEALLRTAEYQKKLCCVIASCVSSYVSNS